MSFAQRTLLIKNDYAGKREKKKTVGVLRNPIHICAKKGVAKVI
jgi:hypothetical protein